MTTLNFKIHQVIVDTCNCRPGKAIGIGVLLTTTFVFGAQAHQHGMQDHPSVSASAWNPWHTHYGKFDAADHDHDGRLSEDEYRAYGQNRGDNKSTTIAGTSEQNTEHASGSKMPASPHQLNVLRAFADVDENHDGFATSAEIRKVEHEDRFNASDADQDSQLSEQEYNTYLGAETNRSGGTTVPGGNAKLPASQTSIRCGARICRYRRKWRWLRLEPRVDECRSGTRFRSGPIAMLTDA